MGESVDPRIGPDDAGVGAVVAWINKPDRLVGRQKAREVRAWLVWWSEVHTALLNVELRRDLRDFIERGAVFDE